MVVHPLMDIRFDATREDELLKNMRAKARNSDLWQWQDYNPFGKPPEDGCFYFHYDGKPSCTLCIDRKKPGHLTVRITPDKYGKMPVDDFVRVLNDFESQIAEPAVEPLSGMTSIDTSKRLLQDYFSRESLRLLELFCKTEDQEKWFEFLLHVHRNSEEIHCDVFGECLRDTGWCPKNDIDQLVHEYYFALLLLKKSEHNS